MKRWIFSLLLVAVVAVAMVPHSAAAASTCDPPGKSKSLTDPGNKVEIALPIFGNSTCIDNNSANGGAIVVYLKDVLRLLSAAVGMTIILMIIIAGVQYITSYGDSANIKSAKTRLVNAFIALMLFLMMFAILQFLVPGGVL